jgi:4-hydroxybenzoate polyprenyltransferase
MRLNHTAFNATFPTFFLGIAAAFQLVAFFIYFGKEPDWIVTVLFCILTAGTYLLNRVSDKEDKFNNILRWRFFNETRLKTITWTTISILTLIIPVITLAALNRYNTALQFAAISIIGFTYTIKIIPILQRKKLNWISLKDVPEVKNLVVCTLWSGSAIVITASILDISIFRQDLLLLFITFFISTCNNTITSDARDIHGDRMRNIQTIPAKIGLKNTFKVLSFLSAVGIFLISMGFISGLVNVYLTAFSLFIVIWSYITAVPQYIKIVSLPKPVAELFMDSYVFLVAIGLIIIGIYR